MSGTLQCTSLLFVDDCGLVPGDQSYVAAWWLYPELLACRAMLLAPDMPSVKRGRPAGERTARQAPSNRRSSPALHLSFVLH